MSARKMIAGLVHKWAWASDDAQFFEAIDAAGGWPLGFQYVGFEHTDERAAGFTNSKQSTGWWTVIASADDYYMWKLSPEALQRVVDSVVAAARVSVPVASAIWVRNSTGGRATISKATGSAK